MVGTRLLVGVLVYGPRIPRWQLVCLTEIERAAFCELIVFEPGAPARSRRDGRAAVASGRPAARHLLYHAYERADRRRFAADDDQLVAVELGEAPHSAGITRIDVGLEPDGRCSPESVALLASHGLDVLLCLGGRPDLVELASCARHGVWCPRVGGPHAGPDEAPLFWETFAEDELSVATLWAFAGGNGPRAIYRSHMRTNPVSIHRNRLAGYERAAHLPLRCLRSLHQGNGDLIAPASPKVESPLGRRTKPTNAQMVRFFWRLGRRVLRRRLHDTFFQDQWYLAFRRREAPPATPTTAAAAAAAADFTTITPPPDRYYADPFLVEQDGRHFVFFEEYLRASRRGRISYVEIDGEGRHSTPRLALARDHHLSYPFLHREGSSIYLVPETGSHGTIEVYRAREFPSQWEPVGVLLEGVEAADATLLHHQGTYYLFAALADGGWGDELYLYFSDSLLGEWRPHPMNPVVSDVRRARPAGRIFTRAGQLIRPGQDCSEVYGRRIVLNRIEQLDETCYREVPVGRIEPVGPNGSLRTHCYDADGLYEVVDGFAFQPRISLLERGRGRRGPVQRFRFELEP